MTHALAVNTARPLPLPRLDFESFKRQAYSVLLVKDLYWEHTQEFRDGFNAIGRARKILIYLDSYGGFFEIALQISEVISDLLGQGRDVRILTGEKCMSSAMTILMSVPYECRYGGPNTKFLIHSARFTDPVTKEPKSGLSRRSLYKIHAANNAQLKRLTRGSSISEQSLRNLLKSMDDAYVTPREALALGLVSAIV